MTAFVYASNADSNDVHVLRLHPQTGQLSVVQRLAIDGQPGPMALDTARRRLYIGCRSAPFDCISLAIDAATGELSLIGRGTQPRNMAHLTVDATGRFVLTASYHSDVVAVSAIDDQGVMQAAHQVLPAGRHAHALRLHPNNRWAYVPCLGADQVMQFDFDAQAGLLQSMAVPAVASRPGAGPRHLTFQDDTTLLVLNERDASIDRYHIDIDIDIDIDGGSGMLQPFDNVATLAPGATDKPWAADLHFSADRRFLLTCERRTSTLTVLRADPRGGRLHRVGSFATQQQPRSFAIDAQSGLVIVAGQLSNAVGVHALDADSGALRPVCEVPVGRTPGWVEVIGVGG